jgi:hypothetical protein
MFIMSYTKFNAFLDMSHRGPPHLFKDVGAVADSPTGIHKAMMWRLFVVKNSCINKGF